MPRVSLSLSHPRNAIDIIHAALVHTYKVKSHDLLKGARANRCS
jgi:hypothetical protein